MTSHLDGLTISAATFERWIMDDLNTCRAPDGAVYMQRFADLPRGYVRWSRTLNEWWPGVDPANHDKDVLNATVVLLTEELIRKELEDV